MLAALWYGCGDGLLQHRCNTRHLPSTVLKQQRVAHASKRVAARVSGTSNITFEPQVELAAEHLGVGAPNKRDVFQVISWIACRTSGACYAGSSAGNSCGNCQCQSLAVTFSVKYMSLYSDWLVGGRCAWQLDMHWQLPGLVVVAPTRCNRVCQ